MSGIKKRKIIRTIGISLISLLILGILGFGGYAGYTFIQTKDIELKSETQIKSDALIFDADMSYLLKSYNVASKTLRLGYNKDTAIKVVLSKKLHDRTRESVKNIYNNTINPIMSRINARYIFEVVEEKDFVKTNADKVIIRYESESLSGLLVEGGSAHFNWVHLFFNPLITDLKILINEYGFDEGYTEDLEYVIMHETLHAFGLGDVYDVENYATLLKHTYICSEFPMFKPNDIRVLAALYFDDYGNVESLKSWIAGYTDNYYAEYGTFFSEENELKNYEIIEEHDGWSYSIEIEPTQINKIENPLTIVLLGISEKMNLSYRFVIENDTFRYTLTDLSTQNVLQDKQGKCYLVNDKLFFGILNAGMDGEICKVEIAIVDTDEGYMLIGIPYFFDYLNQEKIICSAIE